ncbi:MAG: outer membrane protein transport protein [Gammaproteobacteria bacterium]|nr:outer membrane protein transport protein [Gammaproteobacteria bacterium]
MKYSKTLLTICLLPFIAFTSQTFAASFQSLEQSAAILGTADAGTATNTDNASIEYYNPAGMPLVGHPIISLSAIGVLANIRTHNAQATVGGNPITGSSKGPKSHGIMPGVHFIQPISDRFAWGFGVTVPFGLETIYPKDSLARYFSTTSKISTINLGLSAGIRLNDKLSVGVGFDAEKMWAELDEMVIVPSPTTTDVETDETGQDWGYGFNFGILYQMSPAFRLGLAVRSPIKHRLQGSSKFIGLTPAQKALFPELVDSDAFANITLPGSATLSAQYNYSPRWVWYGDVQFTKWDSLKDLTLHFTNPLRNPKQSTIILHYHNAWRASIGQSYKLNNKWTLRNGFTFDQTPTDTTYKTARIPDANRFWITLGANYKYSKTLDFDAGYALILFAHSHINRSQTIGGLPETYSADYRAYANLLGFQVNYHFAS